jgi:hypothetical protein
MEQLTPFARNVWSYFKEEYNALLLSFKGDEYDAIIKRSEAERKMGQMIAGIIVDLYNRYNSLSPYEKGKVQGELAFNVLLTVQLVLKASQLGTIGEITELGTLQKVQVTEGVVASERLTAAVENGGIQLFKNPASQGSSTLQEVVACIRKVRQLSPTTGTADHKLLELEIKQIGRKDLLTEVGYRDKIIIGKPNGRNIAGGIKADVVETAGDEMPTKPLNLFDMKIGPDKFKVEKVAKYFANLPPPQPGEQILIYEIHIDIPKGTRPDQYRIWEQGMTTFPPWIDLPGE